MSVGPGDLREAMRQWATGVAVMVTQLDGRIRAMTANSFVSVSLTPPLVLFCAGRSTRTGQTVASWTTFSANVLRFEQEALATYFAGAWREPHPPPHRFVAWAGVPRLEGCAVSFACRVRGRHEAGDHWIVVAEVEAVHHGVDPRVPLAYHAGQYSKVVADRPAPATNLDDDAPMFPQAVHES